MVSVSKISAIGGRVVVLTWSLVRWVIVRRELNRYKEENIVYWWKQQNWVLVEMGIGVEHSIEKGVLYVFCFR